MYRIVVVLRRHGGLCNRGAEPSGKARTRSGVIARRQEIRAAEATGHDRLSHCDERDTCAQYLLD